MSPLWHDAVDRPRTFYNLQNARQQHWKHQIDSGHQVSSLHDIAWECTAVYWTVVPSAVPDIVVSLLYRLHGTSVSGDTVHQVWEGKFSVSLCSISQRFLIYLVPLLDLLSFTLLHKLKTYMNLHQHSLLHVYFTLLLKTALTFCMNSSTTLCH